MLGLLWGEFWTGLGDLCMLTSTAYPKSDMPWTGGPANDKEEILLIDFMCIDVMEKTYLVLKKLSRFPFLAQTGFEF